MSEGAQHHWKDGEPGEAEFAQRLNSRLRCQGSCPEPELILAAESDSVPEDILTRVRLHLDHCPTCAQLARDLADPDMLALSVEEEERIRRRVFGAIPRGVDASRSRWIGWWMLVPVAAALMVVGVYSGRVPETEQPHVARQEQPAPAPSIAEPSVLKLTKPPLQVPAALLLYRGEEDRGISALTKAFAAYRGDDYAAASKLLDGLRQQYPKMPEVYFYHGVSLLYLGRHADAVSSLEAAKRTAGGDFARQTSWYLALAHHMNGNEERSVLVLDDLCRQVGVHQTEACAGKAELAKTQTR